MPFTVSHVAAVLPFKPWLRRAGLFPAAAIGAMAPDFDLFLPWGLPRAATHGRMALLSFCLPMGLLAWTLVQVLLRPALLAIVPDRWWAAWRQAGRAELGAPITWLLAGAAVLGGAITHLIWDGFTHEGARGVEMLPMLEAESFRLAGHPMHLYRMLQHLSSIVGLAIVAACIWRWQRSLPAVVAGSERPLGGVERAAWIAVLLLLPVVAAVTAAIVALPELGHRLSAGEWLALVVEVAMGVAGATLLCASILLRIRVHAHRA